MTFVHPMPKLGASMLYPWDFVGQKGIWLKDGQVVEVVRIVGGPFMQGRLADGTLVQFDYRDIIPDPLSQPDLPLE
jgi:hypothetical protein